MKPILVSLITLTTCIYSCKKNTLNHSEVANNKTENSVSTTISINQKIENSVIYEANIRQYSSQGTFNAFAKDIPKLKELGVKILWLMPVYPISKTRGKGNLGSYYAVSNYTKINPEFGTLEDFRKLVTKAHENDMLVILDWVANHTGWDHHWIKEHPEFYTKDKLGNITHTIDTDWTDVADLDYTNPQLRVEMKEAMKYWITHENIDGFRCDVAGMVPLDFWEATVKELRQIKPIFMLAEAWEPKLQNKAFDMGYSWDTHHIMNSIAKGNKKTKDLVDHLKKIDTLYANDDILMNFVTNHDENSWNGTINERMGDASAAMTALTYVLPGMPLIYSGQEYGLDKRLLFFEKDSITKIKGKDWLLLKKLGTLKNLNKSLAGGKKKGDYAILQTSNDTIFALSRNSDKNELLYLANFSNKPIEFTFKKTGTFTNFIDGNSINLNTENNIKLKAWGFQVLLKQ